MIEALAKWLDIKPEQVETYTIIHRCKVIRLVDLLRLVNETPERPKGK